MTCGTDSGVKSERSEQRPREHRICLLKLGLSLVESGEDHGLQSLKCCPFSDIVGQNSVRSGAGYGKVDDQQGSFPEGESRGNPSVSALSFFCSKGILLGCHREAG